MAIEEGVTRAWTKSSYSTGNGACVEVRSRVTGAVAVRDSKVPDGERLAFASASWTTFVTGVGRGAFDLG